MKERWPKEIGALRYECPHRQYVVPIMEVSPGVSEMPRVPWCLDCFPEWPSEMRMVGRVVRKP